MKEFIRNLVQQQIDKLYQIIRDIMESELFRLLESFYNNQSFDLLKDGEIVFGYKDIQFLVNKNSEKCEIIIEQLYQTAEKQIHLIITHKRFGQADIVFSIEEFILSAEKAYLTFSYHINSIKPASEVVFWDKLKVYGANLIIKFFPETINKKIFEQKILAEGVKSNIFENNITIDFLEAVKNSPLGQNKLLGYQTLDFIQIIAINIHEKGFGVRFNIIIPDWLKSISLMLFSAIIRKKIYKIPLLAPAPAKKSFLSRFLPF